MGRNINLTIKEEIPKNSAIPPHTPYNALSVEDLINFCANKNSPKNFHLLNKPRKYQQKVSTIQLLLGISTLMAHFFAKLVIFFKKHLGIDIMG